MCGTVEISVRHDHIMCVPACLHFIVRRVCSVQQATAQHHHCDIYDITTQQQRWRPSQQRTTTPTYIGIRKRLENANIS